MGFSSQLQSNAFLFSLLIGILLSCIYDIFRIVRKVIKFGKIIVAFQDFLFWAISLVISFIFLLNVSYGEIRFYLIFGEFLGGLLHHYTLGYLIMKVSDAIIFGFKCVFKFIYKITIKPVIKVLRFLFFKIAPIFKKLTKKSEKIIKKRNYTLKKNKNMLYNTIGKKHRKQKGLKRGENKNYGKNPKKETHEEVQTQIYF